MRITIVGLPGSGKSYLAHKIAEKLLIPHIHIDRFWLEGGGGQNSRRAPNPEQVHAHVREKVIEAIQADSWVSDGFYSKIQPEIAERADIVIFLDIPLWRRLLNHALRILHGKRHKEVTLWGDIQFFCEMVRRESTKASKINILLENYKAKTVVLSSQRDVKRYLRTIAA